ncbi:hypothetical protein ASE00_11745 [Sphingomonas sp. Root710]|uniref:SHOCT domain-containing protein n=1 Tax=Sphingomonas sp. Root710 TaxID=1736594 RepID=UPI0006F7A14F|nr:SHOCT domain-containing protein [Sphingomonas sp. Root710]KRB82699.1 hypothetical protein ASE00_11745 [Sphingomonas sp. Root710]
MTNNIDALERLARLRAAGALTEIEFEQQKSALMRDADGSYAHLHSQSYSEAKRQTRGIRLFIRWFFGLLLVAIVLVGIYFLTRGYTIEEQRQSVANVTAPAPVPEADPAPVKTVAIPAAKIFKISTALLANPPSWEMLNADPNTPTLCSGSTVRIINDTDQTLQLALDGNEILQPIGKAEPKGILDTPAELGSFMITDQRTDQPLLAFNVNDCPAAAR